MNDGKRKWFWSLRRPWEYTPQGYLLAVFWNICELLEVPVPYAPKVFGVIIGKRSRRLK